MEEGIAGGTRRVRERATRPDSSASTHNYSINRMTPTSSSSSSAHLPARGSGSVRNPSAGVSLLQEKLRERKVESARQSRRRSVDMDAERGVQSSPIRGNGREERRPSSSSNGGVGAKGMGVKQIEEQVSTLHKQNFDLKLELYHRRQRQEALEARLDAAEKDQAELQEMNEKLLEELEKRDQAVEEAVGIIVTLEDKIERLMQEREHVKEFDKHYEESYFRPSHEDPPSSPPELNNKTLAPQRLPRMPSFLSENSEGTEALRSLYLPHSQSYSEATLPQLQEQEEADGMDSPRLSVLSKSSFLSVYGDKDLSLDSPERQDTPRRHRASSVEKWVDSPVHTTPVRPSPAPRKKEFLSINDVLESPLQRLEKLKHTLEKTNNSFVSVRPQAERAVTLHDKRKSRDGLRQVFTDQASFEHQQGLPPTPDTISTSTLRHYQYSNDTFAGDAKHGTFLNSTSTFNPITTHVDQTAISIRPRSAGETVTSRREGHGWDTETQDDVTDTCSISSNASNFSAGQGYRSKNNMSPNFFNFDNSWSGGRSMSFANESFPSGGVSSRYDDLRRSSIADPLRSDGTVVPTHKNTVTRYTDAPPLQYGTIPIDTSPRPHPPDRRSSLSASTKLRKETPKLAPSSSADSPASSTSKKSGLFQMFKRSESSPTAGGQSYQSSTHRSPSTSTSSSNPKPSNKPQPRFFTDQGTNGFEEEEFSRATPPPIKRSRGVPASVSGVGHGCRPSSAGVGAVRGAEFVATFDQAGGNARRGSVTLNENAGDEGKNGGGGGGKKWFGLSRAGSLRRN